MNSPTFAIRSNAAYEALGAHAPGQGWSAFDVLKSDAEMGRASRFVMTVWNSHKEGPSIHKDIVSGAYWYRVNRTKEGSDPKKRKALWNAMGIALSFELPKQAILKDRVSKRCSLEHVFDIVDVRYENDGSAFWLKLGLKDNGIGTDAPEVDLSRLYDLPEVDPLAQRKKPERLSAKQPVTLAQLEAVCEAAELLHARRLSREGALAQLKSDHGLNMSTASNMLTNYERLSKGEAILSPMKVDGMGMFVDSLISTRGVGVLPNVIQAIAAFIGYADGTLGYHAKGMEALLERLRRDAGLGQRLDAVAEALPDDDTNYEDDGSPSSLRKEVWVRGPQHAAFKRRLLTRWKKACSVHGVACNNRLVASHIVAWSLDESLRGDPDNGLLLSVPLDSLFDRGLIAFDDEGGLLTSQLLEPRTAEHFGVTPQLRLDWARISRRAQEKVVANLRKHRAIHSTTHGYCL